MQHAIIVGAGRVGTTLAGLGPSTVIRRGERVPDDAPAGPVIVCTRNDDLDAVLEATPADRHADLVFVQNGALFDWLADRGLQRCTQALVYFAVSRVGDTPVDGGRTVAVGRWAEAFAERLAAGGLACRVVTPEAYRVAVVDKLLWTCALGVLCERYGATVGEVARDHRADLDALTAELAGACEAVLDMSVPPGAAQRLADYSLTIPDYRAAVKELQWRNGWLVERRPTPLHVAWLRDLGHHV